MIYLLGLLIAFALGFLMVRLCRAGAVNPFLRGAWGLALGLGLLGHSTFYAHLLLGQFNRWLPIGLILGGLAWVFMLNKKQTFKKTSFKLSLTDGLGLGMLALLSIPLLMEANYYPLGGWDAWSCWNLKAKFIYLGADNWKDLFDPMLWRSNTHYPLLLPLINVWFWDLLGEAQQAVPMLNSVVLTTTCAAILLWTLLELTKNQLIAYAITALVFGLSFVMTLSISQYSDILLGTYLLAAVSCILVAEDKNIPQLKLLAAVFCGLLSFTKTEGTVAAGLLIIVFCGREYLKAHNIKSLLPWGKYFILAALPTILFILCFAPKNEAFINGLLSSEKPADWTRFQIIAVYPWFEFISSKWNGLWIIALVGIIAGGKQAWDKKLNWIPLILGGYLIIVFAYYYVNTFFPIAWWMQTTLSRILYAIIPTLFLWIGLSLSNKKPTAK